MYCIEKKFNFIDIEYTKNLIGINELVKYKDKDGEFTAKVEQIDEFGRLVLELSTGEHRIYGFKEVEMIY